MSHSFALGLPVGRLRNNHNEISNNTETKKKKNYSSLWKYNWSSNVPNKDGSACYLATPMFDKNRKIYIVWDNAVNKVFYTDSDLVKRADANYSLDSAHVEWYEFLECHPYYSKENWNFYDRYTRNECDGKMQFIPLPIDRNSIKHVWSDNGGHIKIPKSVIINDKHRKFISHIHDDYISRAKDYAINTKKDLNEDFWKEYPLPGPKHLKWSIYVPLTPSNVDSITGHVDRRIVYIREEKIRHVAFLLDKYCKKLLYYNVNEHRWNDYLLLDPAWGIFSGVAWRREGVKWDDTRKAFIWRDPITFALYELKKGRDFENFNRMFKILRHRLYKIFPDLLRLPLLEYANSIDENYSEIQKISHEITKLNAEINDLNSQLKTNEGGIDLVFDGKRSETDKTELNLKLILEDNRMEFRMFCLCFLGDSTKLDEKLDTFLKMKMKYHELYGESTEAIEGREEMSQLIRGLQKEIRNCFSYDIESNQAWLDNKDILNTLFGFRRLVECLASKSGVFMRLTKTKVIDFVLPYLIQAPKNSDDYKRKREILDDIITKTEKPGNPDVSSDEDMDALWKKINLGDDIQILSKKLNDDIAEIIENNTNAYKALGVYIKNSKTVLIKSILKHTNETLIARKEKLKLCEKNAYSSEFISKTNKHTLRFKIEDRQDQIDLLRKIVTYKNELLSKEMEYLSEARVYHETFPARLIEEREARESAVRMAKECFEDRSRLQAKDKKKQFLSDSLRPLMDEYSKKSKEISDTKEEIDDLSRKLSVFVCSPANRSDIKCLSTDLSEIEGLLSRQKKLIDGIPGMRTTIGDSYLRSPQRYFELSQTILSILDSIVKLKSIDYDGIEMKIQEFYSRLRKLLSDDDGSGHNAEDLYCLTKEKLQVLRFILYELRQINLLITKKSLTEHNEDSFKSDKERYKRSREEKEENLKVSEASLLSTKDNIFGKIQDFFQSEIEDIGKSIDKNVKNVESGVDEETKNALNESIRKGRSKIESLRSDEKKAMSKFNTALHYLNLHQGVINDEKRAQRTYHVRKDEKDKLNNELQMEKDKLNRLEESALDFTNMADSSEFVVDRKKKYNDLKALCMFSCESIQAALCRFTRCRSKMFRVLSDMKYFREKDLDLIKGGDEIRGILEMIHNRMMGMDNFLSDVRGQINYSVDKEKKDDANKKDDADKKKNADEDRNKPIKKEEFVYGTTGKGRLNGYGLEDNPYKNEMFVWTPIKELPVARNTVCAVRGSSQRKLCVRWFLESTEDIQQEKHEAESDSDESDEGEMLSSQREVVKHKDPLFIPSDKDLARGGVILDERNEEGVRSEFQQSHDDLHFLDTKYRGKKQQLRRMQKSRHSAGESRNQSHVNNSSENSNEDAQVNEQGDDPSTLDESNGCRAIDIIDPSIPPDITHLVVRNPRVDSEASGAVTYYYTDYRTWITWRKQCGKGKFNDLIEVPWSQTYNPSASALDNYTFMRESWLKKYGFVSKVIKEDQSVIPTRFTKKVCTGAKFLSKDTVFRDREQIIPKIGMPLYPINEKFARYLGFSLYSSGNDKVELHYRELKEKKRDAELRSLRDFSTQREIRFLTSGFQHSDVSPENYISVHNLGARGAKDERDKKRDNRQSATGERDNRKPREFVGRTDSKGAKTDKGEREGEDEQLDGSDHKGEKRNKGTFEDANLKERLVNEYGKNPVHLTEDEWAYFLQKVDEKKGKITNFIGDKNHTIEMSTNSGLNHTTMVVFEFDSLYSILECIDKFCDVSDTIGKVKNSGCKKYLEIVRSLRLELAALKRCSEEVCEKDEEISNLKRDIRDHENQIHSAKRSLQDMVNAKEARQKLRKGFEIKITTYRSEVDKNGVILSEDTKIKLDETITQLNELNEEEEKSANFEIIMSSNFDEDIKRIEAIIEICQTKINDRERAKEEKQESLDSRVVAYIQTIYNKFKEKGGIKTKINDIKDVSICNLGDIEQKVRDTKELRHETLTLVFLISYYSGISVTVLCECQDGKYSVGFDTDNRRKFKTEVESGIYVNESNSMYILQKEKSSTFSLAFCLKDVLRYDIICYSKVDEVISLIRNRAEIFIERRAKNKSTKPINGLKNAVMDAYGDIRIERLGEVPITSLLLHEQPYTNYSFFSMCRDAMVAYLNVPSSEIATTAHFMREWFDYLCYLPVDKLKNLNDDRRISIKGGTKDEETLQKYIVEHIVKKFLNLLKIGEDVIFTSDIMNCLSIAGAPISACVTKRYIDLVRSIHRSGLNLDEAWLSTNGDLIENLSLKFIKTAETDNRLQLCEIIEPKTRDKYATIPFLELISYDSDLSSTFSKSQANIVRGNALAHHYHLLCVPSLESRKNTAVFTGEGSRVANLGVSFGTSRDMFESPHPLANESDYERINAVNKNVRSFISSGHYDPNYEHLCHCEGEEHPLSLSDEFQIYNANSTLGVRVGDSNSVRLLDNGKDSGGGGGAESNGGALMVINGGDTYVQEKILNATNIKGGRQEENGYRPNDAQQLIANSQRRDFQVKVDLLENSETAMDKRAFFVDGFASFPRISYFLSLSLDVYPGVNTIFLDPLHCLIAEEKNDKHGDGKSGNHEDGKNDKHEDGNSDKHEGNNMDHSSLYLRINVADDQTFTFDEVTDVHSLGILPPMVASTFDTKDSGSSLIESYWDFFMKNKTILPKKYITEGIAIDIENKLSDPIDELKYKFLDYLISRERGRVILWNNRIGRGKEAIEFGEEPIDDIYVHEIPSVDDFDSKYASLIRNKFSEKTDAWFLSAEVNFSTFINRLENEKKESNGDVHRFTDIVKNNYILKSVEFEWIKYVRSRIYASMVSFQSRIDIDDSMLFEYFWNYVNTKNMAPKTEYITPDLKFDQNLTLCDSIDALKKKLILFVFLKERSRIEVQDKHRGSVDKSVVLSVGLVGDVYKGTVPTLKEFDTYYKDSVIARISKIVRQWFDMAQEVFVVFFNTRYASTSKEGEDKKSVFERLGLKNYILASAELQWVKSVKENLAHSIATSSNFSLNKKEKWFSRKIEKEKHIIPDFMTIRLTAPRNTALYHRLNACAFTKTNQKVDTVFGLLDSRLTSFGHHAMGGRLSKLAKQPVLEYQRHFVQRLCKTYFVDSLITDGKHRDLDMDMLHLLSRMYCSSHERSISCNEYIFRENPSFNFIVVEHVDSSPLPGQLRIVMTSDPRGLSLAFGLMKFESKLPSDKNMENVDDDKISPEFVRNARNSRTLSRITVILRVLSDISHPGKVPKYEFFLLNHVERHTYSEISNKSLDSRDTQNEKALFDPLHKPFYEAEVFEAARIGLKQLSETVEGYNSIDVSQRPHYDFMSLSQQNGTTYSYNVRPEDDPAINTSEERKVYVIDRFVSMKDLVLEIKTLRAKESTKSAECTRRKKRLKTLQVQLASKQGKELKYVRVGSDGDTEGPSDGVGYQKEISEKRKEEVWVQQMLDSFKDDETSMRDEDVKEYFLEETKIRIITGEVQEIKRQITKTENYIRSAQEEIDIGKFNEEDKDEVIRYYNDKFFDTDGTQIFIKKIIDDMRKDRDKVYKLKCTVSGIRENPRYSKTSVESVDDSVESDDYQEEYTDDGKKSKDEIRENASVRIAGLETKISGMEKVLDEKLIHLIQCIEKMKVIKDYNKNQRELFKLRKNKKTSEFGRLNIDVAYETQLYQTYMSCIDANVNKYMRKIKQCENEGGQEKEKLERYTNLKNEIMDLKDSKIKTMLTLLLEIDKGQKELTRNAEIIKNIPEEIEQKKIEIDEKIKKATKQLNYRPKSNEKELSDSKKGALQESIVQLNMNKRMLEDSMPTRIRDATRMLNEAEKAYGELEEKFKMLEYGIIEADKKSKNEGVDLEINEIRQNEGEELSDDNGVSGRRKSGEKKNKNDDPNKKKKSAKKWVVREDDRDSLPRVVFMRFDRTYKYRTPDFSHISKKKTNFDIGSLESLAKENSSRIFLFSEEGGQLKLVNAFDYRNQLNEYKPNEYDISENTAYFLCDGSENKCTTILPTIDGVYLDDIKSADAIRDTLTNFSKLMYSKIFTGIQIIDIINKMSRSSGFIFDEDVIGLTRKGKDTKSRVSVSRGPSVNLWRNRFEDRLKIPQVGVLWRSKVQFQDLSKNIKFTRDVYDLNGLDIYIDRLCTFHGLMKTCIQNFVDGIIYKNKYEQNIVFQLNFLLESLTRFSSMADPNPYFDPTLRLPYQEFKESVYEMHKTIFSKSLTDIGNAGATLDKSDNAAVEMHLINHPPAVNDEKFYIMIIKFRRDKFMDVVSKMVSRIRNIIFEDIKSVFYESQCKLVRLFHVSFTGKFFVSLKTDNAVPKKFKNHVSLRLSENLVSFKDPHDSLVYSWDSNRNERKILDITMPFWNKSLKSMCVMEKHSTYVQWFRKLQRVNKFIKDYNVDEDVSKVSDDDDEDGKIFRDEVLRKKTECLERMIEHEETHSFIFDEEIKKFVYVSQVKPGIIAQNLEDVEHKLRSKLHDYENFHHKFEEYIKKLDELRVKNNQLCESGEMFSSDLKFEEILEQEKNLEMEVDDMNTKNGEFMDIIQRLMAEKEEVEKELRMVSGRCDISSGKENCISLSRDLDACLIHNVEDKTYTWKCPENNISYRLRYDVITGTNTRNCLEHTSLENVARGESSWEMINNFPRWDSVKNEFSDNSVWFEPRDSFYHYLDYERRHWKFNRLFPDSGWKLGDRVDYNDIFFEVIPGEKVCDIAIKVGRLTGLNVNSFYIAKSKSSYEYVDNNDDGDEDDIKVLHKDMFNIQKTEGEGEYEKINVVSLRIKCKNPNLWRGNSAYYTDDGNELVRNINSNASAARYLSRYKRKVYESQRNYGDAEWANYTPGSSKLESENLYVEKTDKKSSRIPCEYDSIRFLGILSGIMNFISVDFGSTGHNTLWENPIVVFRESWFLYVAGHGDTANGEILTIPRISIRKLEKKFPVGQSRNQILSSHIVTNPTGLFAKNVERYFGYRTDTEILKVRMTEIKVKRSDGRKSLMRVPNKKELYTTRMNLFHAWIHCPRNWFWDDQRQGFTVFFFTPDMVNVNIEGKPSYRVQQMAEVHIDTLYNDDIVKYLHEYCSSRKLVASRWMTVEGETKNHISPDVRERIICEEEGKNGYETKTERQVRDWTDKLMRGLKELENDKYNDLMKYYKRITNYIINPHVIGGKTEEGQIPTHGKEIIDIVSKNQIKTRRLFWKLFKEKYGFEYYTFLVDGEKRSEVLKLSPEPLGPYIFQKPLIDEGLLFSQKWEKIKEEGVDFQSFFYGYDFPKIETIGNFHHGLNGASIYDYPRPEEKNMNENELEDWYWDQANVINIERSMLPCSYNTHRFLSIICGIPNDISVDFGSFDRRIVTVNPCTVWRESWFIYTKSNQIVAIPREALHVPASIEEIRRISRHDLKLITNPTGVSARNVERYWGHRPNYFHPDVSKPWELFDRRVYVFHNWLHCPRNWYWDENASEFVTFAFAPDMALVHHGGKDYLVQQLVEYPVSFIFKREFSDKLNKFLGFHKHVSSKWEEIFNKTENHLPSGLLEKINEKSKNGTENNDDTSLEFNKWSDGIMKKLNELRNADNSDVISSYYKNVGKMIKNPNELSNEIPDFPENAKEALEFLSSRQIKTRLKFYSLFKKKFDISYYEFLTSEEKRKGIIDLSPEPIGPYLLQQPSPHEAKDFLRQWELELKKEDRCGFKKFFENYSFPDEEFFDDAENDQDHGVYGVNTCKYPVADEILFNSDRLKWYLDQANVLEHLDSDDSNMDGSDDNLDVKKHIPLIDQSLHFILPSDTFHRQQDLFLDELEYGAADKEHTVPDPSMHEEDGYSDDIDDVQKTVIQTSSTDHDNGIEQSGVDYSHTTLPVRLQPHDIYFWKEKWTNLSETHTTGDHAQSIQKIAKKWIDLLNGDRELCYTIENTMKSDWELIDHVMSKGNGAKYNHNWTSPSNFYEQNVLHNLH